MDDGVRAKTGLWTPAFARRPAVFFASPLVGSRQSARLARHKHKYTRIELSTVARHIGHRRSRPTTAPSTHWMEKDPATVAELDKYLSHIFDEDEPLYAGKTLAEHTAEKEKEANLAADSFLA